jgi:hypothetical protein
MITINFTHEALAAMTPDQHKALIWISKNESNRKDRIIVQKGGFDLPEGYLAFATHFHEENSIYGGIAPNGDVST